jgi:DNA modification methylase
MNRDSGGGPRRNDRGPRASGSRADGPQNTGPRSTGPWSTGSRSYGPQAGVPRRFGNDRGGHREARPGLRNANTSSGPGYRYDDQTPFGNVRRALTHVGGEVTKGGAEHEARVLAEALNVASADDDGDITAVRPHVHAFHSYPARMHPDTARTLVQHFSAPDARVLDPFVGSGTVAVAALELDRTPWGSDLNPLAIELSRAKLRYWPLGRAETLLQAAERVRAETDAARKRKAGAPERFSESDTEEFAHHTLLELGTLKHAILHDEAASEIRGDLLLCLSSLLTKLSRKRADSSDAYAEKRIASGYPAKLFIKRVEEWIRQKTEYETRLFETITKKKKSRGRIERSRAEDLHYVGEGSVDLIVTSPPYVATYDYADHHATRARWLGLASQDFAKSEMGAKRKYRGLSEHDARQAWNAELSGMFQAMARVLGKEGKAAILMADSAIRLDHTRGVAIALRADSACEEAAARFGLTCIAHASQPRPHFHGPTANAFRDEPRREHLLLFARK